jgi:hypothetical protein
MDSKFDIKGTYVVDCNTAGFPHKSSKFFAASFKDGVFHAVAPHLLAKQEIETFLQKTLGLKPEKFSVVIFKDTKK